MAAAGFGRGAHRIDAQACGDVHQRGNARAGIERQRSGLRVNGNYNARMLALRYVYVLALVIWLGGMIVLGALVAPTTFQVLQAMEPATGRALAGDLFGTTIARFHYVAYAACALLLVTLPARSVLGPRPRAFAIRGALIFTMLLVSLYSGVIVLGGITRSSATPAASPRASPPATSGAPASTS